MYYAACCCNGGPPVCDCGDYTYASVSFAHAHRNVGPIIYEAKCDRVCRYNHAYSTTSLSTSYVEAKIYMKCGGPQTIDGLYSTSYVNPPFQKFDPDSVKILYSSSGRTLESYRGDTITDCCEPPFRYPICYHQGQRGSYLRTDITLLPFDVLDPGGDGGIDPFPRIVPEALTVVRRGDEFVGAPDVVTNQPNKYFRLTRASMTYILDGLKDYYRRSVDGYIEEYIIPYRVGSTLNGGMYQSVERWSLIGDECDSHAIGTEVATLGRRGLGAYYDLPYADYLNISDDNVECPATTYFASCCDPLNQPYPATSGTIDYTTGSEQDGGIFSLEFMDEPPPTAP